MDMLAFRQDSLYIKKYNTVITSVKQLDLDTSKIVKTAILNKNLLVRNQTIVSLNKIYFLEKSSSLDALAIDYLNKIIKYGKAKPEAILDIGTLVSLDEGDEELYNDRINSILQQLNNQVKFRYNKEELKEVSTSDIAFYFNYNSFDLNKEAKIWLLELSKQLVLDQTLKISFATHADSRGTVANNLEITKNRLSRIKKYLTSKNVQAIQIKGKAWGEKNNINDCTNDNPCTALEHRSNRRVVYTLIKK